MSREIWWVKLTSRKQLLSIPLELLSIAECLELPDSSCYLLYRDPLTAYKAAAASGGTVVRHEGASLAEHARLSLVPEEKRELVAS